MVKSKNFGFMETYNFVSCSPQMHKINYVDKK